MDCHSDISIFEKSALNGDAYLKNLFDFAISTKKMEKTSQRFHRSGFNPIKNLFVFILQIIDNIMT